MTTCDLIELLRKYEFGGATGKPRDISLNIPNYGLLCDLDFTLNSTDDGLYTGICFNVTANDFYSEEEV